MTPRAVGGMQRLQAEWAWGRSTQFCFRHAELQTPVPYLRKSGIR